MKEVIAIIRMNKMNETKKALAAKGIASMTARKVVGRGKGQVDYLLLDGAKHGYEEAINQLGPGPKLIPKRLLIIVVNDHNLEKTIKTIISVNQTGNPGDGKIFVADIAETVRISSGERGCDAILEQGETIPVASSKEG
ncbi:MAG: P-II family nitrogen regulator [Planctomycetota bacterium]